MLLSSLRRIRMHLGATGGAAITDDSGNLANRELLMFLVSASANIEKYLDRNIQLQSYTEYFDYDDNQKEFYSKAFPITSLTSVYEDVTGLWSGSESVISDSIISAKSRSIVIPSALNYAAKKAIRIIYTGGLAAHAVNTSTTLTSITGTWAVGGYVRCAATGAMGIVNYYNAGILIIENYYGQFAVADSIAQYATEAGGSSTATGIIASITSKSLADEYPDIVYACEMQVGYMRRHKHDIENVGTNKDGTSIRRSGGEFDILIPEVKSALRDYRRILAGI